MRDVLVLFCGLLASCRPAVPVSANAAPGETDAAVATVAAPAVEPPEPGSGAGAGEALPRATAIVDELAQTIAAALAGRELPATVFALPGTRGEQVVTVESGFPEGALTVVSSLLKIDVTLEGCGPDGGLALGLWQTSRGVYLVGLGDRFAPTADGTAPPGLDQIDTTAQRALALIAAGDAARFVLDDAACVAALGSEARCRQTFQEVPDADTLARYGAMLASCEAAPRSTPSVVGLFLRDAAGADYQAAARLAVRGGRLALTGPVTIAATGP